MHVKPLDKTVKFSAYMQEWLYGEEGYYTKERVIGKEGDFYTAVSTSMFFGGTLAKRLLQLIDEGFLTQEAHVIEIGAHKGYLLADLIQFLYTLQPDLLQTLTFVIVEPFEANEKMQKNYFEEAYGNAINLLHVKSLKDFTCKEAFFVANEIFDAFSCEVIYGNEMLYVKNHEVFFAPMDEITSKKVEEYQVKKGELCLDYEPFAKMMAQCTEQFEFVTFDYGDRIARDDFSLRVYSKHQVYPFFGLTSLVDEDLREKVTLQTLFSKSDITYDVNFNHLIKAFKKQGLFVYSYSTQMKALVDFGLIDLLELFKEHVSAIKYEQEMNRVKMLIDPAFMGERFKMVCFRKGET